MLKLTTLQSAGITSGNTVLRLLFRHTDLSIEDVWNEIIAPPTQVSTNENPNSSSSSSSNIPNAPSVSNVQSAPIAPNVLNVSNVSSVPSAQSIPTELSNDAEIKAKGAELVEIDRHTPNNKIEEQKLGESEESREISAVTQSETAITGSEVDSSSEKVMATSLEVEEVTMTDLNGSSSTMGEVKTTDTNPLDQSSGQGYFDRDVKVFNPIPENVPLSTKSELKGNIIVVQ